MACAMVEVRHVGDDPIDAPRVASACTLRTLHCNGTEARASEAIHACLERCDHRIASSVAIVRRNHGNTADDGGNRGDDRHQNIGIDADESVDALRGAAATGTLRAVHRYVKGDALAPHGYANRCKGPSIGLPLDDRIALSTARRGYDEDPADAGDALWPIPQCVVENRIFRTGDHVRIGGREGSYWCPHEEDRHVWYVSKCDNAGGPRTNDGSAGCCEIFRTDGQHRNGMKRCVCSGLGWAFTGCHEGRINAIRRTITVQCKGRGMSAKCTYHAGMVGRTDESLPECVGADLTAMAGAIRWYERAECSMCIPHSNGRALQRCDDDHIARIAMDVRIALSPTPMKAWCSPPTPVSLRTGLKRCGAESMCHDHRV